MSKGFRVVKDSEYVQDLIAANGNILQNYPLSIGLLLIDQESI